MENPNLITVEALADFPDAKILDATYPPPSEALFKKMSIPGAGYL
jgi:hypothetical protein